MKDKRVNSFKQVAESFFRLYPYKTDEALLCYVELQSQVDYEAFKKWRKA